MQWRRLSNVIYGVKKEDFPLGKLKKRKDKKGLISI